ncbi:hypothetical protein NDU88_000436 [Pleurodeles waltl]|uniref:Uncharacterized protein n=1 Tax=Pleurodeles waltl TaxID=8319 RepID=A0AAV7LY47_PLEWA|nr:hypothetical protein NDU88_000436 [Pleurodeles waltl]
MAGDFWSHVKGEQSQHHTSTKNPVVRSCSLCALKHGFITFAATQMDRFRHQNCISILAKPAADDLRVVLSMVAAADDLWVVLLRTAGTVALLVVLSVVASADDLWVVLSMVASADDLRVVLSSTAADDRRVVLCVVAVVYLLL